MHLVASKTIDLNPISGAATVIS